MILSPRGGWAEPLELEEPKDLIFVEYFAILARACGLLALEGGHSLIATRRLKPNNMLHMCLVD
jgi:hypothetical protein